MERRTVVFSALAWVIFAGCAPAVLPAPASRAEACERIAGPSSPGLREFCDPAGAPCAPTPLGQPQECVEAITGQQPFCYRTGLWRPSPDTPYPCYPENGGADCPAWWRCVPFYGVPRDGVLNWCVPGPPCSR